MADGASTTDLRAQSRDDLLAQAAHIGLRIEREASDREIMRRIEQRESLLEELDIDALRDVLRWAGRPIDPDADKAALAREIATVERMRFTGLTHAGLVAYARLRGVHAARDQDAAVIIRRLKQSETLSQYLRRKRRKIIGSVLSKLIDVSEETPDTAAEAEEARREAAARARSLKHEIEDEGVVGGLARRLRGAADTYVHEKLDEIEIRIDRKLDEIDRRLAEWRDREIVNRLRIIKLTLLMTVVVAVLSLGYSLLRARWSGGSLADPPPATQPETPNTTQNPSAG